MGIGKEACTCIVVFLTISLALPISMIVMGSIYLHECPAERYIPIFLIVFGVFSTVVAVIRMISDCCKSDDDSSSVVAVVVYVVMFLTGPFMTAWFIAGNVWVYRLKGKYSTDSTDDNYCNNTLYLYAFWTLTSLYILSGVVLFILLIVGCIMLCRKLAN